MIDYYYIVMDTDLESIYNDYYTDNTSFNQKFQNVQRP